VKDTPSQIRFEEPAKKKLKKRAEASGISQVDLVRFAVDQLFEKHKTTDELLAAYIRSRSTAKA
jgi:hypothetical protein